MKFRKATRRPTKDGWYWVRYYADHEPEIVQLYDGTVYKMGSREIWELEPRDMAVWYLPAIPNPGEK